MSAGGGAMGEERLVQSFLARLASQAPGALGLKDDCALITPQPGTDLVVTVDAVAAGVHFFADDDAADIGWKALAVNISDLAGKAAEPVGYVMALSFAEAPSDAWMARFAEGLAEAQRAFGCALLGGDTDRRGGPTTVTITAFGRVPNGSMVRRAGARAGDVIFVSEARGGTICGGLGAAALGLALRADPGRAATWGLGEGDARRLVGRYLRPLPQLALRGALRAHARAAMDISDGLVKDLRRMARASGVGAIVRVADLPLCAEVGAALAADAGVMTDILGGGDDYEVLAAVAPEEAAAFQASAALAGVHVAAIGHFVADDGVAVVGRDGVGFGVSRDGWDHF